MQKTINHPRKNTVIASDTAELCGVSDDYVRKVIRMDRPDNGIIVLTYMTLSEKYTQAKRETAEMVQEIKQSATAASY